MKEKLNLYQGVYLLVKRGLPLLHIFYIQVLVLLSCQRVPRRASHLLEGRR